MATQIELAEHLCLGTRRVRELLKIGIIPTGGAGSSYDLDACREAYINYLRGLVAGRVRGEVDGGEPGGPPDYDELLIMEKHREKKRQNDIEEGLVAPVALLTDALQKSGAIIVANLESLPLLIKRHWPEVTGDQITMVKAAVAECRNAIADMKLDDDPEKIRMAYK